MSDDFNKGRLGSGLPDNNEMEWAAGVMWRHKFGNDCFVATACFDGADHPAVQQLRKFRDEKLQRSAVGRLFIATYKEVGPPAARFVESHPGIKPVLRSALAFISRIVSKSSLPADPV